MGISESINSFAMATFPVISAGTLWNDLVLIYIFLH